jgi:hypothetical protein
LSVHNTSGLGVIFFQTNGDQSKFVTIISFLSLSVVVITLFGHTSIEVFNLFEDIVAVRLFLLIVIILLLVLLAIVCLSITTVLSIVGTLSVNVLSAALIQSHSAFTVIICSVVIGSIPALIVQSISLTLNH